MIITVDEQQKQIDEQQKQIDSLRAMVTDLVEANDRDLKRGHTLQGTHNYIVESNYQHTQRLNRLERFVNEIIQSEENKELKERIAKLEAHLGDDDDDTPKWLKDMTIQQQIKQVDGDAEADVQDLRKDLTNRIVELEKINNKRANDPSSNVKPLSVSDVEKISERVVKQHLLAYSGIEGDFKDIWARLCNLEDVHLNRRLTKLEKLVSNGVTVREFDKLHEEVNDIHLSLLESEKKLKSQLKSIWHDGVRGTRGQASLHGLNLRLNGAEIALEKLENEEEFKSQVLKIVKEQRKHWDSNISILTARLANSNAFTTDVEQRICDDINSLRKLMLANIKDVRLLKAKVNCE